MFPFASAMLMAGQSAGGAPAAFAGVRSGGTKIQHVNNTNSAVVTWPTGTQAGDMVLIFTGHGFGTNTPTGWARLAGTLSGTNFTGAVLTKTMDAANIAAGSVTITFTGTYYGVIWAVCCIGSPTITSANDWVRDSTGATSRSMTTSTVVNAGDTILYWASGRLTNLSITCDRGTLKNTLNANTQAGGAGYVETAPSNFPTGVTANWTFSSAPTGDFYGIVALRA